MPKFYKDLDNVVSQMSEESIKNKTKEFVSWAEYKNLTENISETSLISATKFLNDCG